MAADRLIRILTLLSSGTTTEREAARLCEVCADVSLVSGAGIMLMAGDVQQGSVCSSNEVSALIEELQYTLGEGLSVDVYHRDGPVLEPDLANPMLGCSRAVGLRWRRCSRPRSRIQFDRMPEV